MKGLDNDVKGVVVDLGSSFGLKFGFNGVEREETDVGEGAGDAASSGADEGAFENRETLQQTNIIRLTSLLKLGVL